MDNLTTTLIFVTAFIIPLFSILTKDGVKLYKSIRDGLEDGKLTNEEIDLIVKNTGVVLRSIVRLVEKFK